MQIWWASMGWLKWPNLLLVLVALYLSTQSQMGYYSSPEWINIGRRYTENLELIIYSRGRIQPGEETSFLIEVSDPVNLVLRFSGEEQSINLLFDDDGEQVFTLITPNQTSSEVIIEAETSYGNSKFWNLGRLYR
jgi:hypothetical protein